jgi:hypothetical protein
VLNSSYQTKRPRFPLMPSSPLLAWNGDQLVSESEIRPGFAAIS